MKTLSQRDRETLWELLSGLCEEYESEGAMEKAQKVMAVMEDL
jgi:hypothetical protein